MTVLNASAVAVPYAQSNLRATPSYPTQQALNSLRGPGLPFTSTVIVPHTLSMLDEKDRIYSWKSWFPAQTLSSQRGDLLRQTMWASRRKPALRKSSGTCHLPARLPLPLFSPLQAASPRPGLCQVTDT